MAARIAQELDIIAATALLTFDGYGVTGHANHVAVHAGALRALAERPRVAGWALESVSLARKFSGGLLDWPRSGLAE